ncbi:hypothetical protein [Clostridium sp.]|uniref:hypothetical protein n=1 Tax=Clostridium sp. TaxID=1506 RepID=UPI002FC797DD
MRDLKDGQMIINNELISQGKVKANGVHRTDKCIVNYKDGSSNLIYTGAVVEFEIEDDSISSIDVTYLNLNMVDIANLSICNYFNNPFCKVKDAYSVEILHSNGTRDIVTRGVVTEIVIENDKIVDITVIRCNVCPEEIKILSEIKHDLAEQFEFYEIATMNFS